MQVHDVRAIAFEELAEEVLDRRRERTLPLLHEVRAAVHAEHPQAVDDVFFQRVFSGGHVRSAKDRRLVPERPQRTAEAVDVQLGPTAKLRQEAVDDVKDLHREV